MNRRPKPQRPIFRRRQFIVDRPMQLAVLFSVLGILAVTAFLFIGAIFVLPDGGYLENLNGEESRNLVLNLGAAYFALAVVSVSVFAIIVTHRVAGPAMVLERAIRSFIKGDLKARTKLRRKDYLQGLSLALADLAAHVEMERNRNASILAQVEERLAEGDTDGALRVLQTKVRPAPTAI